MCIVLHVPVADQPQTCNSLNHSWMIFTESNITALLGQIFFCLLSPSLITDCRCIQADFSKSYVGNGTSKWKIAVCLFIHLISVLNAAAIDLQTLITNNISCFPPIADFGVISAATKGAVVGTSTGCYCCSYIRRRKGLGEMDVFTFIYTWSDCSNSLRRSVPFFSKDFTISCDCL